MKIAIDIDGTIYDTERNFRVQGEIYDIEELGRNSVINPTAMWAEDRYSWTEEENQRYLKKFVEISEYSDLIPGAKEIIGKFKELGINMIIITARGGVDYIENKEMIEVMQKKMEEDELEFDEYFWASKDKAQICKEQGVDLLIDDSPIVCEQTSKAGVKTIFLHDSGIDGVEPNGNLIEVHNWGEIYRVVRDFLSKNS